jgi:hypothetical protein
MVSDNPWFLITHHEIEEIQKRLHSLEGEIPGTSRHNVGEINGILHEVRDRQP